MKKYKSTIENGYQTYLERYPDYSLISIGDWDYPLQGAVLDEKLSNVRIINSKTPLSEACLIEYRDDIPSVEDLPMEDLAWLPIGLTQILKIQRSPDHDALWIATAKMLPHLNADQVKFQESLVQNFETLVRAVLCSSWQPSQVEEHDWSDSANENRLLKEASIMARYMAFPTLEGMVKSLIRRDIQMDGTVRSGRRVLTYPREKENITENDEVSNLGYLLWHLEQDVADGQLQKRMEEFRDAVKSFFNPGESEWHGAYGFLSNQRNTVLHGQMRAYAEFGVLLNLLSLLILNIDHVPEERRRMPVDMEG